MIILVHITLKLQNYIFFVSVKFQYGVKSLMFSKCLGNEEGLVIFLLNITRSSLYASSQSVKNGCLRTMKNKLPTNQPTNQPYSMSETSSESATPGSSD